MSTLGPREELASIAASLRAYLEWQEETGAVGIPRRPRPQGAPKAPAGTQATTTIEPAAAVPIARPAPPPEDPDAQRKASLLAALSEPTAPPAVTTTAVSPAPVAARPARSLTMIAEEVRGCQKCSLGATRKNTVFSRGNPEAKLCFIGEAPGADEDAQGLPFVGRAGQLLDKMIGAMGLDPEKDVYVCNIIKCRPPGNRRPEPNETEACIPYLHEQVAIIEPKVIVALGNTAVASLIGTKLGITKIRGQWKLYRGKIPVMPTYHPSYLLRPSNQLAEAKRQAWEDLQAVMKELGLPPPPIRRS